MSGREATVGAAAAGRALAGLVVAGLALALFVRVVGPNAVAETLAGARPAGVGAGAVLALASLGAGAWAYRRLYGAGDRRVDRRTAVLAYGAGQFGRFLLPVGNAAGPTVTALAFHRLGERRYEDHLAVATTHEVLSLTASASLALVGLVALLVDPAAPTTPQVRAAQGVLVAVLVAALAAVAGVRYRWDAVRTAVRWVAVGLGRHLGRVSGRAGAALSPAAVDERLSTYRTALEATGSDRRALAGAAVGVVGTWAALVAALGVAGASLGVGLSPTVVLFVVPAAGLVNVTPLPGGLGGYEATVTAALVTLGGVSLASAGAVVLLYRLLTYWLVLAVGGACAAAAVTDGRRP